MAVRPHVSGSLFCHFNYKKVTRNPACKDSKSLIENECNPHSVRIGAATNAAKQGKSADEIMLMGRWKSQTYKRYILIDTSILICCSVTYSFISEIPLTRCIWILGASIIAKAEVHTISRFSEQNFEFES